MTDRISKDQYFMSMTKVVALRSTCLRHRIGCVIVNDDKIVSTGYNGAVTGAEHCLDKGCIRDKLEIPSGTKIEMCESVHAEANALIQAGKYSKGGTLYVNVTPCITCSKMIVNAGITRVVIPINEPYSDRKGIELLKKLKIEITEVEDNHEEQ